MFTFYMYVFMFDIVPVKSMFNKCACVQHKGKRWSLTFDFHSSGLYVTFTY